MQKTHQTSRQNITFLSGPFEHHTKDKKMTKTEALKYIKNNPGKIVKLDWWDQYMGIKYENNKIVSIPGAEIDTNFLQEGNYIKSNYFKDKELGGLFAINTKKERKTL